jgi:hypothetical protein
MRLTTILKLLSLSVGLMLAGAAHAQGWTKFYSEQDQFIVNFPGAPDVREVDYTTESGATVPSRVYSVEDEDSRYAITVVDYTEIERCALPPARGGAR